MGDIGMLWSRSRALAGVAVLGVVGVVGSSFCTVDRSWGAEQTSSVSPVSGEISVGGGVSLDLDERTGLLAARASLVSLPGLGGEGETGLSLTYSHALASAGTDPFGFGVGWTIGVPFVRVDGSDGVRVFGASGGEFETDGSTVSGLARYVLGDMTFRVESGSLAGADGSRVEYAYVIDYLGGKRLFFNAAGDPVVSVGVHGERSSWVWAGDHRLEAIVDGADSRVNVVWGPGEVRIAPPVRYDGEQPEWVVDVSGAHLNGIIDPVSRRTVFSYDTSGLLSRIVSPEGADARIDYQPLGNKSVAVKDVRVVDDAGTDVFARSWAPAGGERLFSGWPTYQSEGDLWASHDQEFTYQTRVSNGSVNVVSSYNSLGLLTDRMTMLGTESGDGSVVREERLSYPGGGVADPQTAPAHYLRPSEVVSVFANEAGGERSVRERLTFDDRGRVSEREDSDGTVSRTTYDEFVPAGARIPIGLVLSETVTGRDGVVSETRNELTADHRSVAASVSSTGTSGGPLVATTRVENTIAADGFVTAERSIDLNDVSEGPREVVTNYARVVGDSTVSTSVTSAAETSAQFTTTTVVDKSTGLAVESVDAVGRVASTTYDKAGRVVREVDYAGKVATTEYENRVTRVTIPGDVTKTQWVDVLGRTVKAADNIRDGVAVPGFERVTETRSYEKGGTRVVSRDARGLELTTMLDFEGRPVEVVRPDGVRQLSVFDDVANTTTTGVVAGSGGLATARRTTTTQRDDHDRVVRETAERLDGVRVPEVTTEFDGLGRTRAQTSGDLTQEMTLNPDGSQKTVTTTPAAPEEFPGHVVRAERERGLGGVSTKKTLVQEGGQVRDGVSRVLDAAGRTAALKDQAGAVTNYTYTPDGLVDEVMYKSGVKITNTYDELSRALVSQVTQSVSGAESVRGFEYDEVSGRRVAVFDPADRAGTEIRYSYDAFGNITSVTYPDGKTIESTFDEHGRKVSSKDVDGFVSVPTYNGEGAIVGITQTSAKGDVVSSASYDYDTLERLTEVSLGNGVVTRYTFTDADEIATEETTKDGVLVSSGEYVYDAHGNLAVKIDKARNGQAESTERTDYAYDAFDHLIESTVRAGSDSSAPLVSSVSYEVGVSGDVLRETSTRYVDGAAHTSERAFEYNGLGHLTAVTTDGVRQAQEFDAAGNQTKDATGTTFEYNTHNQPVKRIDNDGSVTTMSYWADGKRQDTVTEAGERSRMYWDGQVLTNEQHTTSAGSVAVSYLMGVGRQGRTLVSEAGVTDTNYYVTDRHGSVVADTDASGQATTRYQYSDYGIPTITHVGEANESRLGRLIANPIQYSGEYTNSAGEQFMGVRSYSPHQMRFRTADTAELHNLYAYASGNPITRVDPTGQTEQEDQPQKGAINQSIKIGAYSAAVFFSMIGTVLPWTLGLTDGLVMTFLAQAGNMLLNWGSVAIAAVVMHDTRHPELNLLGPRAVGPIGYAREVLELTSVSVVSGAAFLGSFAKWSRNFFVTRRTNLKTAVSDAEGLMAANKLKITELERDILKEENKQLRKQLASPKQSGRDSGSGDQTNGGRIAELQEKLADETHHRETDLVPYLNEVKALAGETIKDIPRKDMGRVMGATDDVFGALGKPFKPAPVSSLLAKRGYAGWTPGSPATSRVHTDIGLDF